MHTYVHHRPAPANNPPDPAIQKAAADFRKQARKDRRRERKRKLAFLPIAEPGLRDIEAAAHCHCHCHPQPGRPHSKGVCPCQMTKKELKKENRERQRALTKLLDTTTNLQADQETDQERAEAEEHAARLGVTITSYGGLFPFVVTGSVDGRAFFLRSRGGAWRIEIADDATPTVDPWTDHDHDTIEIASGLDQQLSTTVDTDNYDPQTVITTCATAVRTYLGTPACTHSHMQTGYLYCPDCGTARNRTNMPTAPVTN